METQTIINGLFGIIGALGGYLLNSMRQTIISLQAQDMALADKVQRIEVIVAGEYVKRAEMNEQFRAVNETLQRIEDKLDHKADKKEFPYGLPK